MVINIIIFYADAEIYTTYEENKTLRTGFCSIRHHDTRHNYSSLFGNIFGYIYKN